jgi:fructose-bisphosphate aldolase, class I
MEKLKTMNKQILVDTTNQLLADGKGLLAMDESNSTCNKRFSPANRRRSSLLEVLEKAGIISGIKVDMGAKPMAGFPNEKITEGLDGLRNRLEEYAGCR